MKRIAFPALLLAATLASGQWLETTFRVPDTFGLPKGYLCLAQDPDLGVMYVAGDSSDSILVVDDLTFRPVERFAVGGPVSALARPNDRAALFCALGDSDQVVALDCRTRRQIASYGVGYRPGALLYCDAERKLCAAAWGDSSVSVIDIELDSVTATISGIDASGLFQGMCYVPSLRRAFFVSRDSSQVVALDLASDSVIARIGVGDSASAIAYNSANGSIYCACWGGSLYSIDALSCSVRTALQDTIWSRSIACDSVRNRIYATVSGALAVVDGTADTVMQKVAVEAAFPHWVGLDVYHNRVFVAGGLVGNWPVPCGVTIIDGESFDRGRLLPGPYLPRAFGRWGADEHVFCAGWAGAGVFVFDGARGRPVGVLGDRPHIAGLLADSVTGKLYCMTDCPSALVVDPVTNRVRASVPLTHSPGLVCLNSVDRKLYVCAEDYSGAPGIVTVVDAVGDTVLKEIDLGRASWTLAYNPDDDILYAAGYGPSYGIWVIDGKGDSVIVRVENDGHTHGLVYNAAQRKLYAYSLSGEIAVIDPSTNSEIQNIKSKMRAGNSVLNSSGTRLYIGSYRNDSVCVIDCVDDNVRCYIPVAGPASVLCYDALDDLLFVGNSLQTDSGYLTVVDCAKEQVLTVLPIVTKQLFYDRQTNAVYDMGQTNMTVIDGQSRTILQTFATGIYPEHIASAPGWPSVYVSDGYEAVIAVIHKASGPVDFVVRATPEAQATVVRGTLDWTGTLAVMYDMGGRRVLDVHRGGNDVSRLRPGVYFIRQNGVPRGTYARKVVIAG